MESRTLAGSRAAEPSPARQIDLVKKLLEEAIAMASSNSTRVREVARRLGYTEPPSDPKPDAVAPVPRGHVDEIHGKLDVLTLINAQTRELLSFIDEQV